MFSYQHTWFVARNDCIKAITKGPKLQRSHCRQDSDVGHILAVFVKALFDFSSCCETTEATLLSLGREELQSLLINALPEAYCRLH